MTAEMKNGQMGAPGHIPSAVDDCADLSCEHTYFLDAFDEVQLEYTLANTGVAEEEVGKQHSGDEWELISEVASVKSFGTTATMTYADIVKHIALSWSGQDGSSNGKSKVGITYPRSQTKERGIFGNQAKDDDGNNRTDVPAFDDYFCMEGVKGARGGKTALMFKGNPRTDKQQKKEKRATTKKRVILI